MARLDSSCTALQRLGFGVHIADKFKQAAWSASHDWTQAGHIRPGAQCPQSRTSESFLCSDESG